MPGRRKRLCGIEQRAGLFLTLVKSNCYGSERMWRHFRRYIVAFVALLVLAFFAYQFRNSIALQGFRWSMVGESVRHARLTLLLLSLLTFYACYAVRSVRWMRFCEWLGEARFGNVFGATLMGFSCVFLLGRAAEPIRPVLIARKDALSIPGMLGVYVLERAFDLAATALIAALALLSFEQKGIGGRSDVVLAVARSTGLILLVGLVVVVAFLVYFRYHGAEWLARRLQHESWRAGWRRRAAALLEGFSDGLRGIRSWRDVGAVSFLTAVHWTLVAFAYFWAIHAFPGSPATMSIGGVVLVLAFGLVGSMVQFPAVGGGAQAATFVALTLILGVEKGPAAVVSIVLWLLGFAGCCIVGLPLLFREGWSMGDLRRMARAEERAGEAALLGEVERAPGGADAAPGPAKERLS